MRKRLNKIIASILIITMVISSEAFYTLADSVDNIAENVVAQDDGNYYDLNNEDNGAHEVRPYELEGAHEVRPYDTEGANTDSVGANSVSPNTDAVGAKLSEPADNERVNSDNVGANSVSPNTDAVGANADSVGANSVSPNADAVGANTDSVGANEDSVGAKLSEPVTSTDNKQSNNDSVAPTEKIENGNENNDNTENVSPADNATNEVSPTNSTEYAEEPEEDTTTVPANTDSIVANEDNGAHEVCPYEIDGAHEVRPYDTEGVNEDNGAHEVRPYDTEGANTDSVGANADSVEANEDSVGANYVSPDTTTVLDEIATYSEISLEEIQLEENLRVSTDSEFEELYNDNVELVEKLRNFNIIVEDSATIKFFKELELSEDGPYLVAKMDGKLFLADDRFNNTYNPYKNENRLFGATNRTITLDFGVNRPLANKSSNWSETHTGREARANNAPSTVQFTAQGGQIIKEFFVTLANSNPGTAAYPIQNFGSGDHIKLPEFGPNVWDGFEFKGWVDSEGVSLTTSQKGCFLFAFQYDEDITYTASWEKVTTGTHTLNINYFRATYSTVFSNPFVATTSITNIPLVTPVNLTLHHGDYRYMDAAEVYGYKIVGVKISTMSRASGKFKDIGTSGLLTLNADKNRYVSFDTTTDLTLNSSYTLDGCMPNHNLYIEFMYEPNENQCSAFKVFHVTEAGKEKASETYNVKVEDVIQASTRSFAQYVYKRAEVSATPIDNANHIFGLGHYHCESESYTNAQVNAKNGEFKAVMPNQDVYIYYYYELGGIDTTTYIETVLEQLDGTKNISTVSIVHPVGSSQIQTVVIDNKEDEGYSAPVPGFKNVNLEQWTYTGGIGGADGELRFFVDTDQRPVITLVYGVDTTSAYWTKLGFFYDEAGHGRITPSQASLPFDKRFVKRADPHTLSELIAGIDITADQYYRVVWYKNRTAGIGPTGASLSDATPITFAPSEGTYNLFAAFEEDPAWWVDANFTDAAHCYITGTTNFHVVRGTAIVPADLPTVTPDTGYVFNGWVDESGNPIGTTFDATHTYSPNVTSSFPGSPNPVKPVAYLTYGADGQGTAHVFGVYPGRLYVLTDTNNIVLAILDSDDALADGIENLMPGTTYRLYEVMDTVNPVLNQVLTTGAGVSDPYVFGVKALNSEPTVTNNADGTNTISFTASPNVEYALLDDRYNVVSPWSTSTTFTGLTKGTYYLVVARELGGSVAANADDAIRNGKVVYTRLNDLSTHNYRLIVIGNSNAFVQTGGGSVTAITIGGESAKFYSIQAGTAIALRTNQGDGYKTKVLTDNVNINENSSSHNFTMPESDVVIYDMPLTDLDTSGTVANTINMYNSGAKAGLMNLPTIKSALNTQAEIATAITNHCTVNHHIVINRYATKKSVIDALGTNNGKVAPYEYTVDVQSVVLGLPYPNNTAIDLNGFASFDKGMIGNSDYSGSFSSPYTADASEYGISYMPFGNGINNGTSFNYIKRHKVNVSATTAGIEFNQDFIVPDGGLLDSNIAGYTSDLAPRMANIFDNATPESNAKEYIFDNVTEGTTAVDLTTLHFSVAKQLTLNYHLNQDREDKKTELSAEIISAQTHYDSLTNDAVKNTLQTAINDAQNIRTTQKNHTVPELEAAILALRAAKDAAVDPPASDGDEIEITLNANGGTVSQGTIIVQIGDAYTYSALSSVTVSRNNYTFNGWYDNATFAGAVITDTSVVGQNPSTTLYAKWTANERRRPTPVNYGGSGGSGGGGGGGGVREFVIDDKKMFNEINVGSINFGNNSGEIVPVVGQTVWIGENNETGRFYLYDPITNKMELKLGNKTTLEPIQNQWVVVSTDANNKTTYRTDIYGNIITGKYATEDGNVYYLSENQANLGALQVGWIYDANTTYWYYGNPRTGTLLTGWNAIDGKDYYFIKPDVKVTNNLTASEIHTKRIYGMMLANVDTIDGFTIDVNGQRVSDKPYLMGSIR